MGDDMISVTEIEDRLDELNERVRSLEDMLDGADPDEIAGRDAREVIQKGETREVVVQQTSAERDGQGALAYLDNGLVTFIDENGCSVDKYDKVRVRITHVKPNVAHAGALEVVDGGEAA